MSDLTAESDDHPEAAPDGRLRISVLVPSLNSGHYIADAIASALSQVPAPHEVIVQDGGSTDASLDVLKSFGAAVSAWSEPDDGQSDALNRAFARSTGDVLVWLNADDLLVPGAFAAVTEAFRRSPGADLAFGDFDMIREDGSTARRFRSSEYDPRRVFVHGCYIFSGAIFQTRALMERVGPYDGQFTACMDFDYLVRIGEANAVHVGRTVAQFRLSEHQKSATMRSRFLAESHAIRMRAAAGSRRLQALTLALDARDSAYLLTNRLRYSRAWAAVRGHRRL